MRQRRRSWRSLLGFVVAPAVIGLALLAVAAWGYHQKSAADTDIARYGVTTTGVIGSISAAGLGINDAGTTQYDQYGIVNFTARGSPETARIFLVSCSGICAPHYQSGEKLLITYDSRNTADAVLGRYTPPLAPVSLAIILALAFGLIALVAAVANLVLGV
jgi:hypothetical protein